MRFEVGSSVRIQAAGAQVSRVKVTSLIGTRAWTAFQIDVVADGIQMSAEPDSVSPLTSVSAVAQERKPWRVYPLVDHVADKVCAIIERHDGRPSTRYKDLIDLVAIVERATVVAEPQMQALSKEGQRRMLDFPPMFDVPDQSLWTPGYRSEARRAIGLSALELEDALTVVKPFLDPLLEWAAVGVWNCAQRAWLPNVD
jgi:hypothetical protein